MEYKWNKKNLMLISNEVSPEKKTPIDKKATHSKRKTSKHTHKSIKKLQHTFPTNMRV